MARISAAFSTGTPQTVFAAVFVESNRRVFMRVVLPAPFLPGSEHTFFDSQADVR